MILKNKDAENRLNSPLNLMNKLKNNNSRNSAMSLFVPTKPEFLKENKKEILYEEEKSTFINPFLKEETIEKIETQIPALPELPQPKELPTIDTILENSDSKIKLGLAHDKALDLLTRSVEALSDKLDNIKAEKLPSVITSAAKVVEGIRKERVEAAKAGKDREVHYHFYTPIQKKMQDYEVIETTAVEATT